MIYVYNLYLIHLRGAIFFSFWKQGITRLQVLNSLLLSDMYIIS